MKIFRDYYNNEVKLSFDDHPFSDRPKHVLVICRHQDKWLLTKHKERGLEFPGGKVEIGETAEQAAIREVDEETGGVIKDIHYIGQYYVEGKSDYVIKNVYYARIGKLESKDTYFETYGPVLLREIPENVKYNNRFSFIMKDGVLEYCMGRISNV
ncbi:RNA deprotection pyrophosphohydrolase [Oceanobacillus bengalensis]|uniref:Nucleoside triphosphatase YtkD n=1 Tax=Oceanobacillus bengalensis TaxID=1435466 RepID=A0A494YWX0_9BACI|nr:nucleoside triphosphatase YtkD [Oceanobacillus bengalensis]RKQ14513.1 nucleoside triphosphatase YtkD [Oceanobacillus bengalensis]